MKLQDHLHYTDFKMNHNSKKIKYSTEKMVDAEEKANGNNVGSQEQQKQLTSNWLLSIYYAKLDGMLWNCRRIKNVIALYKYKISRCTNYITWSNLAQISALVGAQRFQIATENLVNMNSTSSHYKQLPYTKLYSSTKIKKYALLCCKNR